MHREICSSGSPWELRVGYARAVRVGDLIAVAGPDSGDGVSVGPVMLKGRERPLTLFRLA
jgi:hypothetical protein